MAISPRRGYPAGDCSGRKDSTESFPAVWLAGRTDAAKPWMASLRWCSVSPTVRPRPLLR